MKDFVVEMALVAEFGGIVDIKMVVEDIYIVEDTFVEIVEMVEFHNYILANLVHVGFGIVVEAMFAMALEYSMNFEEDIDNSREFVERIVEESLVTKVSLVPYNKDNLFLAILLLDSFEIL